MATPTHDKYYLRTLHEEIALFDRKIAHLLKYDTFATDAERSASANKMNAKRDLLVRTARQLASEGIEFKITELPRSLRDPDAVVENAPAAVNAAAETAPFKSTAHVRQFPSPFAGTVLDGRASVQEYKRNRAKAVSPQA